MKISEKSLLIRINVGYPRCKTSKELYDYTRGVWVIGANRDLVDYAFAVYNGVVKEVYKIFSWKPVIRELYEQLNRPEKWSGATNRWMFDGEIDPEMSQKYKGQDVSAYFKLGAANPIMYVNV